MTVQELKERLLAGKESESAEQTCWSKDTGRSVWDCQVGRN